MTFIKYQHISFNENTLVIIHQARAIIEEYENAGYTLTLRQLYYQFVARDILENSEKSYKQLGSIVTNARMTGKISWTAIEDRGRGINAWLIEEDETEVLRGIEYGLSLDFWKPQNTYVECWVEKEALSSVIQRPCQRWETPYMPCKGYLSASEAWRSGQRFEAMLAEGRRCVLIHLGDHDPSGIDMTRDNQERLGVFAGMGVEVRRIALNMDQVNEYAPPPNPTKMKDSRSSDYVRKFGMESWELDALNPKILNDLIEGEILSLIDMEQWNKTKEEQDERRLYLERLYNEWEDVKEFLQRDTEYE